MKNFVFSVAILAGTIIGVGVFSLPYITLQVGAGVMFGYFLILGTLVVLIHLFLGELALKTPDLKRLPGFAKVYLGITGERIAFFSSILGIFGAILAYLIVGGEFLAGLFSPIFGGNSFSWTIVYFIIGALLIFFGIRIIAKVEFWGLISFFIILLIIFFKNFSQIKLANFSLPADLSQFFLPYGPILFSLWGAALIPEIEEMLKEKKYLLKKVIIVSTLIPILIYLFFIYLILGITGPQTTESALTGLKNFLNPAFVSFILFFGVLTTFTSFITLGLTLKKIFWYDLKINKDIAWLIVCFIPLILFLIGIKQFILVIGLVGAIMLGIDGILILLMYQKLQLKTQRSKIKSLFIYSLILIFLIGILYEIIYFIK